MTTANLLIANFALILLGFLLRRYSGFEERFWDSLERFVYYVLFPALLFGTLATNSFDFGHAAGLIATGVVFLGAGMLLGYAGKWVFSVPATSFASGFQCAFRFNSYIGFALLGGMKGPPGVAAFGLLAGAMILMANLASVWALARNRGGRWVGELARNPLVVSTSAGLVWSVLGFPLPPAADSALNFLGQAALPLGLIAVGAGLRLLAVGEYKALSAWLLLVKLVLVPAIAYAAALWFGLSGTFFTAALVLAALPAASSAYILTVQMEGDGRFVASLVALNLLAALFTLPFWLAVAER